MGFSQLNLNKKIINTIHKAGYSEPTEIQWKAIPKILRGFDIRASAQTGTGKTAAFLLPVLHHLLQPAPTCKKGPRVLILAPTRELAMQILNQANTYSQGMDRTRAVCIVGGIPYHIQNRRLSRSYDVLVATPGRLIDYLDRGKIDLSGIEVLVLDEADRMLDLGFVKAIEQIVAATPDSRQTLLFSATLSGRVIKLSEKLLHKPMDITIQATQENSGHIVQSLLYVDDLEHKNRLLESILSNEKLQSAVVFTATKLHTRKLESELRNKGHRAAALHGDMNQKQRSRTISQLREGKLKILIATDVAARGIDIRSITHVINFDLPRDVEDYVHRIGRTGRAGSSGTAFSFVTKKEGAMVQRIQKFTGQEIPVIELEGLEPRKKQQYPLVNGPRKRRRQREKSRARTGSLKGYSKSR